MWCQTSLESQRPGATVVPLIVSSDKTQLTLFGGKMAYPVYVTIGNIPKDIRRKPSRRAHILIAYIPTSKLEGMDNKAARRRALANLFHSCLRHVLGPIALYGETGIDMVSGDGVWYRCHPIFACFVGDYPEQTLVTCTYYGRCPKCQVPPNQLGELSAFPSRDYQEAIEVYSLAGGDVRPFHAACREAGLKPVYRPFWETFPLVNVYLSITPDVLHQLLQGVMKHLISWLTSSSTFGPSEVDARCRSIPPNHHIKLFSKGITTLSRISGKEHKSICRILIGLVIDLPLPHGQAPTRVLRAVRALLDFLYLAQFRSHTTDTIRRIEDSLTRFHENKAVFTDLGVRKHFNIPKIHSLVHYSSSITLFGTTDNYNTEQTERLHIDFTKEAYRATNHKDELRQMTTWLGRREKIQQHAVLVGSRQELDQQHSPSVQTIRPPQSTTRSLKMTRHPSVKAVSFDDIHELYGAIQFQDALAEFIACVNYPGISRHALNARASNTLIPFRSVAVFHKVKFISNDAESTEIIDAIHVRPEQKDTHGHTIPPRFDTALVLTQSRDGMQCKDCEFLSFCCSNLTQNAIQVTA
jgi:hypothetical protein